LKLKLAGNAGFSVKAFAFLAITDLDFAAVVRRASASPYQTKVGKAGC